MADSQLEKRLDKSLDDLQNCGCTFLSIVVDIVKGRFEVKKYICAPCSNCKGAFRDILNYYGALEKSGITYGGLVELIVNAMVDIKEPFIKWEQT